MYYIDKDYIYSYSYVSIVAVGESNRADHAETIYGDDDQ